MSIDKLGQTLLADVRQQREANTRKAQKRKDKDDLLALGVSVAGKIGNAMLESNFKNFLQNEKILQEKAQYKTAVSNVGAVSKEYQAIQQSGLSTQEYFAQQLRPVFEAKAKENLDWDVVGDAGGYNAYVTSEVSKLAEQQAKAFEDAYSLAGGVASAEDYAAMIELNSKRARSTNVGDAAIKTVGRWFSGKSRDDIEQEALDSIVNSKMGGRIDAFNAFVERYNQTKSLVTAYDYANMVVPEVPKDQLFSENVDENSKVVGNSLIIERTVEKTNRNTGEKNKSIISTEVSFEDTAKVNSETLKTLRTSFDFMKDGRSMISPQAFSTFVAAAQDAKLDPANIQTMAEYNQLSKLFGTFTKDANNLNDSFKDSLILSNYNLLTNTATDLSIMLGELKNKNDAGARAQYFQQNIMPTLNLYKDLASNMGQVQPD